jgi:hypothetical protein
VPSDSEYEDRELAAARLELDGYDVRDMEEPFEALESTDPKELGIIRNAVIPSRATYGTFRSD